MARNGSGVYSLPGAYNPVVTNTPITIAWANTTLTDAATAITGSIAANGETTITANLPMWTYKHTGVGNASARDQYAAAGQVQDSTFLWCGTAGGTANALTLTASPVITAVSAGMTLRFKAGASPNSGATTVAIGGAAAIAVQNNGAACSGGEIAANKWYEITVDDSLTSCQLKKIGQPTYAELGVALGAQGGTGIANTGKTITLGGNISTAGAFTISGAFASTFTLTNTTTVTFPTSGTLAVTTQATDTFGALTDVTTNNVSATAHGFCPKFPNNTTTFFRGDGTYAAVPGALTLLATLTPTAAAAVNSLSSFSSSYDAYLIVGEGIAPSANDTLKMQLATGGALDTGSNYYGVGTFSTAAGSAAAANMTASGVIGTSGKGCNFVFYVLNANDATSNIKSVLMHAISENATANNFIQYQNHPVYIAANAISGFGFFWNAASNFKAQGKIRVYGVTNT